MCLYLILICCGLVQQYPQLIAGLIVDVVKKTGELFNVAKEGLNFSFSWPIYGDVYACNSIVIQSL